MRVEVTVGSVKGRVGLIDTGAQMTVGNLALRGGTGGGARTA